MWPGARSWPLILCSWELFPWLALEQLLSVSIQAYDDPTSLHPFHSSPIFFNVLFQELHSRDDWHFLSASSRINQCTKWLRHCWLLLRWLLLYRSPQFPYNPGQKYMVHLENVQCSRHRPCSMMKTAVFEFIHWVVSQKAHAETDTHAVGLNLYHFHMAVKLAKGRTLARCDTRRVRWRVQRQVAPRGIGGSPEQRHLGFGIQQCCIHCAERR